VACHATNAQLPTSLRAAAAVRERKAGRLNSATSFSALVLAAPAAAGAGPPAAAATMAAAPTAMPAAAAAVEGAAMAASATPASAALPSFSPALLPPLPPSISPSLPPSFPPPTALVQRKREEAMGLPSSPLPGVRGSSMVSSINADIARPGMPSERSSTRQAAQQGKGMGGLG
jgi:hypothetical protein